MKRRCPWCGDDPLYVAYHDEDWGVPLHDDVRLFEMLVLEGAQAGLSWLTILRKREAYRAAFDRFRPEAVAAYGPKKIEALLSNPGIVRNRAKVESAVRNAREVLRVQAEFGSLDIFLWEFVGGRPVRNAWRTLKTIPCQSSESDRMSRELRQRGFSFVGTTICYAFMQSVGMVNDHLVTCFRYRQVNRTGRPAAAG